MINSQQQRIVSLSKYMHSNRVITVEVSLNMPKKKKSGALENKAVLEPRVLLSRSHTFAIIAYIRFENT